MQISPSQQGVLLHALSARQPGVGVEQCLLHIDGALDLPGWQAAWQAAVDSVPDLRSHFAWRDRNQPVRLCADSASLQVQYEDLRGLADDAVQVRVNELRDAGIAADHPPLMRLAALQLDDQRWLAVWSYHHALLDAPSAQRILAWVIAHYAQADPPALDHSAAPPPMADPEASRRWWAEYLQGVDGATPLPWSQASGSGLCNHAGTLNAAHVTALRQLADLHGMHWQSLIEAAWGVLLWRHVDAQSLVFGVVESPNEAPVGCCINTVVRHLALDPEASVLSCATSLADSQREAAPHCNLGLAAIQRQCPGLDAGVGLCNSVLMINEMTWASALARLLPDVLAQRPWTIEHRSRIGFPVSLQVDGGDIWQLRLEHDLAQLSKQAGQALQARLRILLISMAEHGLDGPVRELPWLTADDREAVTQRWNQTTAELPFVPVPVALHAHAQTNPKATAIVFAGKAVTYSALGRRVHNLAAAMQAGGVQAGDRVAVGLHRSVDLIAGMLAVQQLGAAYVPCDPHYPPQRLQAMLEDSDASLWLASSDSLAVLPSSALPVLLTEDVSDSDVAGPVVPLQPDMAAYVIFTSGSTGRPKGVMVSHGNLSNLLQAMARQPGLRADQRILALASLSFDMAVPEVYLPLITGATMVLASQDHARDGSLLSTLLDSERVDVMQGTPTTYRLLLGAGWKPPAGFKALAGGEAVDRAVVADLYAAARGGIEVWNMYGPTETTVWSTCTRLDDGPVSIGRPIANTQCHVVDPWLQPVAPGASGELLIGGLGVSLGYFNQPERTAERFIDNPFGAGRLYRTGDRVRWSTCADGAGELIYVERLDFQVKLRGFRIELGEVEARLAQHEGVDQAVVVLRSDGGDRLVAYLTGCAVPDAASLHAWAAERLPAYMVPAQFVALDTMPLSPNGKIDRKALPPPAAHIDTGRQLLLPRTALEQQIADAWCGVLGVAQVGINDNFFEIGGDSLRLVAVLGQLQAQLPVPLAVADLFRHTTVYKLASFVESSGGTRDQQRLGASTPGADGDLEQRAAQRRAASSAARVRRRQT